MPTEPFFDPNTETIVPSSGPVGAYSPPYHPKAPRKPIATQRGKTKHAPPDPRSETTGGAGSGGAAAAAPPPPPAKPPRKTPQAIIRAERQPPIPKKPDQFPWHALRYPPEFRFLLRRSSDGSIAPLDDVISVTWDDNDAILRGNLQVQEAKLANSRRLARVAQGDQIACQVDVHDGQGFRQIWLMRTKSNGLTYADGVRTFDIANDMSLLQQSEGMFQYTGTGLKQQVVNPSTAKVSTSRGRRARKGGWTGRDIILDICDTFHIPVGAMYQAYADQKIGNFYLRAPTSPLEAIRKVLNIEQLRFKRRLTARWNDGALYITPLRRSPHLRALGPTLIDAAFKSELRPEFASALRLNAIALFMPGAVVKPGGKGTGNPGPHYAPGAAGTVPIPVNAKHGQTFVDRQSDSSVAQFGYVRKILWSPDARNVDTLNNEADAYLSVVAKPRKTLQLTLPGIPYLYRGDAIKLGIGDTSLRNQLVWVTSINSTVTPQQYLQTVTVVFDDPFVNHSDLMKMWKLKTTRDQAVGGRDQRQRADGLPWYAPVSKSNKSDTNKQTVKKPGAYFGPSSEHTGGG